MGLVVLFVFYFTIAFLPILLGADKAAAIVGAIPTWIIDGLSVAGGVMPAIGFAMLLKIMLKKEYIAFMILGFLLVTYFNLPILGLALLGVCIALYDYFSKSNSNSKEKVVEEVYDDGI